MGLYGLVCYFSADPVGSLEVVDGLVDKGCEIPVCWEKFTMNAVVFSGLFSGPVNCFVARNVTVPRGPGKDYAEKGGGERDLEG